MKLKNIKDQVMVITGASSGIGLATAKMAAKKGARVVVASRNKQDLDRIVDEIEADGGEAFAVKCDVSKPDDMRRLKEQALEHFGTIDTWVNNAGVGIWGEIMDTPLDEARQLFDTNFWSIHYGSMEAIDALRENGGVLINLGSEVSERSVILQAFYSATKHAIKGYTEGLRTEVEMNKLPIKLTLIRPAAIDTPFSQHATNHLKEGQPSLPPPVYHPDVVAMAICEAAQTGKRDVYIGGMSKFANVFNHVAPALFDVLIKGQVKDQKKGTLKPHTERMTGLMHAPAHEGDARGGHDGHVMNSSVWTSASLHPAVAVGALVGLGAVAYGAASFLTPKSQYKSQARTL